MEGMDLDEFLESLMQTEKGPKFPISMYYSEGTKYLNLLQYEKALEFFNEAINYDPTHFRCLLKRSRCLMCLRRYDEALEDASRVLNLYPDSAQAIDLKGQAQYLMGDYEGGYLTYLEGRKMKPVNNNLRLGKQLCEEALNNSLHPSCKTKIQEADVARIAKTERDDKKFEAKLKFRRSARECFGTDAEFLEELMTDKNLTSIHGYCKETVEYIKHRERFWSMETPLHTRKKREQIKIKEFKKEDEGEKQLRFCNAAKRRATLELSKRRFDFCLLEAGKLLKLTESLPEEKKAEKVKLRCDAFHLLSLAYNKAGNSHLSVECLLKEIQIAYEFDLLLPQARAYHRLGEHYQRTRDTRKILLCLDKVVYTMSPESVEKLMAEGKSAEEDRQLQEAREWADTIMFEIKMAMEESETESTVDKVSDYSGLSHDDEPETEEDLEDLKESKSEATESAKPEYVCLSESEPVEEDREDSDGQSTVVDEEESDEWKPDAAEELIQSRKTESKKDSLDPRGESSDELTESVEDLSEFSKAKGLPELKDSRSELGEESIASERPKVVEDLLHVRDAELHDLAKEILEKWEDSDISEQLEAVNESESIEEPTESKKVEYVEVLSDWRKESNRQPAEPRSLETLEDSSESIKMKEDAPELSDLRSEIKEEPDASEQIKVPEDLSDSKAAEVTEDFGDLTEEIRERLEDSDLSQDLKDLSESERESVEVPGESERPGSIKDFDEWQRRESAGLRKTDSTEALCGSPKESLDDLDESVRLESMKDLKESEVSSTPELKDSRKSMEEWHASERPRVQDSRESAVTRDEAELDDMTKESIEKLTDSDVPKDLEDLSKVKTESIKESVESGRPKSVEDLTPSEREIIEESDESERPSVPTEELSMLSRENTELIESKTSVEGSHNLGKILDMQDSKESLDKTEELEESEAFVAADEDLNDIKEEKEITEASESDREDVEEPMESVKPEITEDSSEFEQSNTEEDFQESGREDDMVDFTESRTGDHEAPREAEGTMEEKDTEDEYSTTEQDIQDKSVAEHDTDNDSARIEDSEKLYGMEETEELTDKKTGQEDESSKSEENEKETELSSPADTEESSLVTVIRDTVTNTNGAEDSEEMYESGYSGAEKSESNESWKTADSNISPDTDPAEDSKIVYTWRADEDEEK